MTKEEVEAVIAAAIEKAKGKPLIEQRDIVRQAMRTFHEKCQWGKHWCDLSSEEEESRHIVLSSVPFWEWFLQNKNELCEIRRDEVAKGKWMEHRPDLF